MREELHVLEKKEIELQQRISIGKVLMGWKNDAEFLEILDHVMIALEDVSVRMVFGFLIYLID
jgi:hypothetical protein